MIELDGRVGALEREQARLGERVESVDRKVDVVQIGIDKLLERDAAKPAGLTARTIAATCGGLASVAIVVWWLIGSSPAVEQLRERVLKLDDPQVGRVPALEKKVERLGTWQVRVTKDGGR